MDLNDYERHLIGLLCWDCHAATGACNARQRQCPRCRKKWSYDRRRTQWELLKAFCLNATAHHTARFARCDYRTAYHGDWRPGYVDVARGWVWDRLEIKRESLGM